MKSPRCKVCKHAMSEHGPEGCQWCGPEAYGGRPSCTVVGSFEKPWEADLDRQIQIVVASPAGEARDRLLRSLHSGYDDYSSMRREALLESAGNEHENLSDAELRWVCRGLTPQLAMEKVMVDDEKRRGYATAAEKLGGIE